MQINQFEYLHGLVLVKLLRKDVPVSLKLIETNVKENWATYVINDDIALSISKSISPRDVKQGGEGTSWTFNIKTSQFKNNSHKAYLALVCGQKTINDNKQVAICLLNPEHLTTLIDLSKAKQSITVKKPKGKGKLIVFQDKVQKILVAQKAIQDLEIRH
jgi:hypothetical protein